MMTDVVMQFPDAVSDARGAFRVRAMARERSDGSWEGWLEFVAADHADPGIHTTPIETHQRDRVTMERWASGLTRVYTEGALSRARAERSSSADSELVIALQEIVEALDRRLPQVERAGESEIAVEASRLRAAATQRLALLRRSGNGSRRT